MEAYLVIIDIRVAVILSLATLTPPANKEGGLLRSAQCFINLAAKRPLGFLGYYLVEVASGLRNCVLTSYAYFISK